MFTVKIKTQNAAFEGEDKALELARILREIAQHLEDGQSEGRVQDSNGNTVGAFG
jgi:hypothetical protein